MVWDESASDSELLRASLLEPEAFGVFYDRHFRPVVSFLYRRTASAEVAAELAAETFAEALASRARFSETYPSGRAWLLGIASHKLSKSLRRGRVERTALRRLGIQRADVDDSSIQRIEELASMEPVRVELRNHLDRMSPKISEALILRVGMELPYPDVARRLGCTEAAARVRVARGLAALTTAMGG